VPQLIAREFVRKAWMDGFIDGVLASVLFYAIVMLVVPHFMPT
jgi:hypothetical protein